jgi:ASC-1-like (ASCH) protein
MKKYFFLPAFFLASLWALAQTDSIMNISLNEYVKDERFDKYQLTLALFLPQGDTIYSMDFEGTRPVVPIKIKKPQNCKSCAYGNVFFSGTSNPYNPGYVSVLVCGAYNKNPLLYIDQNQNFDFSDDSSYKLPYYEEKPLEVELSNAQLPGGKMKIVLTKNMLFGQKYEFKQYMDEYYEMAYKGRKFIGVEFTYREQRYITRGGFVRQNRESFKIALQDVNANGIYNEPGIDKVLFVNAYDTVFDATNPINFVIFSKKGKPTYFEKNDRLYEVVEADAAGKFIRIKHSNAEVNFNRIAVGKKVPNVKLTLVKGQKLKLSKLRRKEVYIYFGNRNSKNFHSDTLLLRQIAALDSNNLKVIFVLFVNKSYELRIYNSDADPNYLLAYGTKELTNKLKINSVPQGLYLGKRRRVKKYGLNPNEFMRAYLKEENK